MIARRDVTSEHVDRHTFESTKTRGENWSHNIKRREKERRNQAAEMLRNKYPNDIFAIARICLLPVYVVRELEAEYKNEKRGE